MIGILFIRGITKLKKATDLQTISICLTCALSFIFSYEAIYKLSFFFLPWKMPPEELREFVIQIGIALIGITGFAFGKFRFTRFSMIFTVLFALGWIFWLLVGFPQLSDGQNFYIPLVPISLSWQMIYILNRGTKVAWFFVYLFMYA